MRYYTVLMNHRMALHIVKRLALLSVCAACLRGGLTLAAEKALAGPPNILFAIADDWGRHAGAYGT